MAGIRVEGNTSGNVAEVTANNELKTSLSLTPANIGGVRMFSENDPTANYLKSPETSIDYRLRVGTDTTLFVDTFNSTTQNTNNWSYVAATLTATQPGNGFVQLGTVQGTAAAHGAYLRTFQYFPLFGTSPLAIEFTFSKFTANLIVNEIFLAGLGLPGAGGTAPTDGVWIQLTSSGLIGVLNYNNTVTQTGVLKLNEELIVGSVYKICIVVSETEVEFWLDDVLLIELPIPSGVSQPYLQATLPFFMQKYCSGAVSNTNTMRVGDVTISLMDIQSNKPWTHQLAGCGQNSNVGQSGHTQGKTSLWANNTAPTAVALTNTTAAFTGLGGISAVLPTLAVASDGIIFSYQNPVSTINISGRNLYITGVQLQGVVSVILAGGPVIYAYAVAYGHTAVSLATGETASFASATTHSPRIMPMGLESYAATAAVGTLGSSGGLGINFAVPLVVRPGEYIQLIARNLGTVTTTGAITVVANFNGYFE